jgi:hypothetical protein
LKARALSICLPLLLVVTHVAGQANVPQSGASALNTASTSAGAHPSQVAVVVDDKLRADLAAAVTRLSAVESSIGRSADRADAVAVRSSWFSLATVLGTALFTAALTLVGQHLLMRHQRKMNARDSQNEVANAYVDWQLNQLSELYGPLRALLGQSNEIYRQMNRALISADKSRFQLVDGDDFDGKEFQINFGGDWTRFRTVQHLVEVYNRGYGVEPYFDDVVKVGERMADVIRDKAGYARSEDADLLIYLGKYLGHFFVLQRLHEQAKAGQEILLNEADRQATFPNKIQTLVSDGFATINKQVMEWRKPVASV